MSDVICVLGMSRSGTSLTTRILNLCGVHLGSKEDFLPPMLPNPDGNWEHLGIVGLNEEILRFFGGSWEEPPPMPPRWEESADLDAIRGKAEQLLEEAFAGHDLWGWKDPRNCLTLPFWQHLQPGMRYVICLRNPLDVAASLRRRNELFVEMGDKSPPIDMDRAIDLWREYVARAIAHTAGRPRIFVSYEEYFDDWRVPVRRLADFVGGATLDVASEQAIEEAIKDRLWHHRTPPDEVMRDPRIPSDVAALHLMATGLVR
jgi:hypothetical protein